ncbi:hypothetical protein PbDSM24746_62640 [Paenibacillus macerans]|nr:hypothetical protein PbDSM24746_62640 [Paenibacillus macerans]GBK72569.1 hypothetical protein PbJCM17693_62770 [Paenibacillus macerans]
MGLIVAVLCFPAGFVHAAEEKADLSKYPIIATWGSYGSGGNDVTNKLTDGDINTFVTLGKDQAYKYPRMVWSKFSADGSVTIDITKFYASFKGGNTKAVYYRFYDHKGNQISAVTGSNGTTIYLNKNGVAGYSIEASGSFYVEHYLAEVSLEGTVHEPEDPAKYVISSLQLSNVSNTSFRASWTPVPAKNLKHYLVTINGSSQTTSNTTVLFEKLDRNKSYTVTVRAVDIFDKAYDEIQGTYEFPPPTPPARPGGLKAEVSSDRTSIDLRWAKSTDGDFAGYDLYVTDVTAGIKERKLNSALMQGTTYTFRNAQAEHTYRFKLVAVNVYDQTSEPAEATITVTKKVTDSDQEETNEYLLVTWTETEGAVGYKIYLNSRLIAEVGPEVREFKITKAMGYIPGALVNKAEVKAIFADGSEGGSNPGNGGGSGGGTPGKYLDFIGVIPMIETSIGFLWIYRLWIILIFAIIFSPVLYGLVIRLIAYAQKKNWIRS